MREVHTIQLGVREVWGGEIPFGLGVADRRQHVYVIGKSGTGKTALLRNSIIQDIAAGHGVGVIDPHGDLALELLNHIPSGRTDDVVYFDATAAEYPIGLNLLQNVPPDERHRVASALVSSLKAIWRDSWGPRMEYILYAAIAALLETTDGSLLGVQRILSDESYRSWVVRQVKDPAVLRFWSVEFAGYDERFRREAVAPIENKVGQLLMAPPVRNLLGQVRRKIDARFMMDDRRIFIANLAKGMLGEDKANLLGSMLVSSFQLAAMSRADIPEEDRQDFYLYVDEFHNFTSDSFASILSEARKYRLCMTLSHQFVEQLSRPVSAAVFGNVGNLISFRVGEHDARSLSREFGGAYTPETLGGLGNFNVVAKLLENGETRQPFIGRTLPPIVQTYGKPENLIRRSREKYATPRRIIEDKISRWMRRHDF
jgi:type IV secretory pathway TraG/TraD family ATPase VirD4